jgi:hypothetical protein
MDCFDMDKVAEEVCRARGVTRRVLRSPEEIAQIRQQKQQMQAAQQIAQTAEPASNAIKNLAQANAAGAPV